MGRSKKKKKANAKSSQRPWWPWAVGVVVVLVGLWSSQYLWGPTRPPTPPRVDLDPGDLDPGVDPGSGGDPPAMVSNPKLPPLTPTSLANVGPDAKYVGVEKCIECHRDEHRTWLETMHSRALADIDVDREPPDGKFTDAASGRSYRVYRRDGQLRHEESIVQAGGKRTVLADHAVRYVMGSGAYSRSYLLDFDGFLTESPITWFAGQEAWNVSPGYDHDPDQPGFSRPATFNCVLCHAGRVEPVEGSIHKMKILEQRIGCERCHGPGSLHVQKHASGLATAGDDGDLTIVHPARLAREQTEAICFQCHMTNDADVELRGRRIADFQPGRPLSDYRHGFAIQAADKEMTVVGHGQQMQLSRCYQESQMTCITCHHPHKTVTLEQRVTYYRDICLQCHQQQGCGLPAEQRRKQQADDSCVACHMPTTDTDIPHFAFTHHRVGIHEPGRAGAAENAAAEVPPVAPLDDDSALSELDRRRNLGLAYLSVSEGEVSPQESQQFYQRADELLSAVESEGLRDPVVDAALARILWRRDRPRATRLAQRALASPDLTTVTRRDAASVLGEVLFQARDLPRAREAYQYLTTIRRNADDHLKLGFCQFKLGDSPAALATVQKAVAIEPHRSDPHILLADILLSMGQREQAEIHEQRARLLDQTRTRAVQLLERK